MEITLYWLSLPMLRKKLSCHPLETWKQYLEVTTKTTFTLLMALPTRLKSWFSVIFPFSCLCHAVRSFRYGTDRTGSIYMKTLIAVQHVLMCMRGMLKTGHEPVWLMWSSKCLKTLKRSRKRASYLSCEVLNLVTVVRDSQTEMLRIEETRK